MYGELNAFLNIIISRDEIFVRILLTNASLLRPRERLRSIVMSTPVCVCLSLREDISGTTRAIFLSNFLCMLPMAVARSSSGVVTICYVFPVLWMTSLFSYNGPYSGMNFATNDQILLKFTYLP